MTSLKRPLLWDEVDLGAVVYAVTNVARGTVDPVTTGVWLRSDAG